MMSGLVHATSGDLDDRMDRALSISQLKRALNGHGFARGALFGLRSEGTITEVQFDSLHAVLESILSYIHSLAERAWCED
jgi:hypothetical protein